MKHIIETNSPPKLAALLAGAALLGLVSQSALALTASGTTISNSATLTYLVGGVDPTGGTGITSAAADFVVDNKVDVLVTKTADVNVIPGSTKQATVFTVTNNGNTTQRFALAATVGASTLTNPLTGVSIYRDNGATPGAWDATDTLYVDAGTFGDVLAGSTLNILIVADAPAGNTNGQAEAYDLAATTVNAGTLVVTANTAGVNTAGVDVVFADAQGSVDGVNPDGIHSATSTFTVASAVLSISKTATLLCDPINGSTNPKNIPGAAVQYAITISNAVGASTATLTQVTDTLVAALGFDTTLISGAGVGGNCVSGTGSLSATGFGAVRGTAALPGYAAPGLAANAIAAGASHVAGTVTIDFTALTGIAGSSYGNVINNTLPADSSVTVYFNTFVQ